MLSGLDLLQPYFALRLQCASMDSPTRAAGLLQERADEVEAVIRRLVGTPIELPVVESLVLRFVVLIGRDVSMLLEQSLRPHGLSETDYRTLLTLHGQPQGVHPGELCASVARSPANMTRIADGLCERGLITRVPSDEDRRRTLLRITPAGEALVRLLAPQSAERNRAIFAHIPEAQRAALLELLRTLISGVDAHRRALLHPHVAGAGEPLQSTDPSAAPRR